MDGSGEDRINNLPDGVVGHILSRLPMKDAVRTSILSKDWEYMWTSIYNIELDNGDTSLRGQIRNKTFVSFVERVLHLTRNSRIKSFRLCSTKLDPQYLKISIASIFMRGIEKLEIRTFQCKENTFVEDLYTCRSLTELKLVSHCTLFISLMKNCFLYLKILHLGHGVYLSSDEISNSSKVIVDFPVLEDLELIYCTWRGVKSVEINAPALIRFVVEGHVGRRSNDYLIKIDAPKLEKFESRGLLDNYVVAAPTISNAVLDNWDEMTTMGLRAHAILKEFQALKYLKLSGPIIKALTESNANFPLPCFNQLKKLEIDYKYEDPEILMKMLQVMPCLELLSLEKMKYYDEGWKILPSGFASRLKVVQLFGFIGSTSQIEFAESVLKIAEKLETLLVFVGYKSLRPKLEIKYLLSTSPKSSTRAKVVVN